MTDVVLHKGISCVLFSGYFEGTVVNSKLSTCKSRLLNKRGRWKKGVNSIRTIPTDLNQYNGLEMDVHFDSEKKDFIVFHDSAENERTQIRELLKILNQMKYKGSLWLDFKNLSGGNQEAALNCLTQYSISNNLKTRIIVESDQPELLVPFCRAGFFTSYYVPFFNPYLMNKEARSAIADTIAKKIRKSPVSALSGYYFQYPFLKYSFPGIPLLTWVENPRWSFINYLFQKKIRNDSILEVVIEY